MNKEVTLALNYALNKGFQIHPSAFKILETTVNADNLHRVIKDIVRVKSRKKHFLIDKTDLEEFLDIKDDEDIESELKVLSDPTSKITSSEGVEGYTALFSSRYTKLKKIVSDRPEAKLIKNISVVIKTKPDKDIFIGGLVNDRSSDHNIIKLTIEDQTGILECIVFDKDLQKTAETLLQDQFVLIRLKIAKGGGYIANDIIMPDVASGTPTKSKSPAHAVFLSDLHIGSKYFLEEKFNDFTAWLSSDDPVAKKVRFVIIGGDLVDGVGIYPNQDKELVCQSLEEQLLKAETLLAKISQNIQIVIMPGNHDPGRRALPQPAIPEKYNKALWSKENYHMVGNPSLVSLNGVKVLMFHGQSIDDVVKVTPGLSYDNPVHVMRQLLKARHLSPIYGSQTPIAPELEDMMVIDEIPDIFHAGHVHVMGVEKYKGIILLNSGTWQGQTPFQSSVGITPTPAKVLIVNLKTFDVLNLEF